MKRSGPARGASVVVHPGELFFGRGEGDVQTLLGSCVAATFWHRKQQLGGLCHYLLPERPRDARPGVVNGRYGVDALAWLHDEMLRAGTRPGEYVVRLFGGGNMFPGSKTPPRGHVGDKNIATGRRMLAHLGFAIASEHVAGDGYRVITLHLDTGEVSMRYQSVAARRAKGQAHG
jgi:chemotaxis protein CheD